MSVMFKKIVVRGAWFVAFIYISACAWVYFRQEKILFRPQKIAVDKKFFFRVPVEDVWIEGDGAKLHGLYFKARIGFTGDCKAQEASRGEDGKASEAGDVAEHRRYRTTKPAEDYNASTLISPCESSSINPKGLIIFFHGNDQTADQYGESTVGFTNQGFDYFVPDYRGYGKSSGTIQSEKQFLSDLDRFYEWAKTKHPEEKIVLAGRSLGGAAALYLASKSKPRLTVAIATFFNIAAMADIRYPFFPKFLLRYHFLNNIWIAQAQSPVYVVYGAEDETIPPSQSQRLAALAKGARPAFVVPGASHGDLQKFPLYHQILRDLLSL